MKRWASALALMSTTLTMAAHAAPPPPSSVETAASQPTEPSPEPHSVRADYAAVAANAADQAAFERLLAGLPQVRLDDEGTMRTYYIWEGDMLLNAEEIRAVSPNDSRVASARPWRCCRCGACPPSGESQTLGARARVIGTTALGWKSDIAGDSSAL